MSSSNESRTACQRLLSPKTLLIVYIAVTVMGTITKLAPGNFEHLGVRYQPLQNFAIFRNAFFHLVHGQDLYGQFRLEQWDQYKYSPTFALLMGPLAALPYDLGTLVWNLLNMGALFLAIWSIPAGSDRRKAFVLWFILLSAIGSMLNAQSNDLVVALMVGGWTAQERNKPLASSLFIVLSAFVKLFGVLAFLPCLLCRERRKLVASAVMWTSVLAAAPLVVVSPKQLIFLYVSWYRMLQHDQATRLGLSLMGLLKTRLHLAIPADYIVLSGAFVLVLVPMIRWDAHQAVQFRFLVMASVLIWAVMFNHLAESSSFIIAVTGVALWYYSQTPTTPNLVLLATTFVCTCLSSTEIVPRAMRQQLIEDYVKLLPLIPVWLKLQYDLLRFSQVQDR